MNDQQYFFDRFSEADEPLDGTSFSAAVMAKIYGESRRAVAIWAVAILIAAPVLYKLLQLTLEMVAIFTSLLPQELTVVDNAVLADIVSPVNSVGAVIAVAILVFRWIYRRVIG